jgi:hypothetical protein
METVEKCRTVHNSAAAAYEHISVKIYPQSSPFCVGILNNRPYTAVLFLYRGKVIYSTALFLQYMY